MDVITHLPGYLITEQIYAGSRTLVYRGVRESDSRNVVIKLLRNEYPNFNELVQFCNQYTIAKNLNFPSIIKPLTLEAYHNSYALVMEDFGGVSLSNYLKMATDENQHYQSLPLAEFLNLALQLTDMLQHLYQNRVIHKDIKPSNILINPDTKQIKLIDFSISSLLPRETQEIQNPNVLEGTLAYLSPEQTGRMNRGIDYRTDFYSLGVTFYELLTGGLPFDSEDAMELVHCHLAKQAIPIDQINPEIPLILSKIVSKLMAKNAEDRYQSALGLKHDLQNCLDQLQKTETIKPFALGERDISDRFIIPDKLYGRETEVSTLLQAFDRVSLGATEMMLVAGFSGIGKTAVVNEVHKPIVRQRGYFIKGKYDQFQRNIPFSAFVQAFRDLMGQLLTESEAQIQQWQSKILAALGENGQVIIEVIPELERIIGQQPPAIELSGTAAQNRFNLLFQKFTQVFTSAEHPLVMFLDDLQWADSASLNLMQLLMADTGHLLLMGAYRDNEVNPAHPLMLALSEIQKTQAIINTITLAPLSQGQVNQLVADTLKCTENLALPLSQLVFQKTKGNPFFATQFLKALHEDRLIQFTPPDQEGATGGWQCDIAQVTQQAVTDDVVAFMALQLRKLPPSTQQRLQLAACIGNQFDLATLAIVSEQSEIETAAALWKALQEGLILPLGDVYKFYVGQESQAVTQENSQIVTYKFLHDRVQQAAYSLIPDDQKQTTHYQIGQLLLQQISSAAREDRIFEIVNQLNHGTSLITQQTERDELAQLNLIACCKARAATAYQASREYANTGLNLLGENAWQQQYEMTLSFHNNLAELAMLCGDFEAMEQLIETIVAQAHSLLEKVNVYRMRIQANTSQNKLTEAIAIGIKILEQLGVTILETPTLTDIQQSIQEISELIGDRKIEDFVHLPMMTDANKVAIIQIASSIMPSAYLCGSPLLFALLNSLSVKLSLRHGNIFNSAYNYVSHSLIICNILQDVDLAIQFSQLAFNLVVKLDAKAIKPEVLMIMGGFILHRKSHIKETLLLLSESYLTALEVGNLQYAGHSGQSFCLNSFWCGQPLATVEQDTRTYYNGLVQVNQLTTANYCRIYWQSILNLLGFAEHPTILSGSALEETEFLPMLSTNDLFGWYNFYLYKLTLCFLFGEVEEANSHALQARNYLRAAAGRVNEPVFYLYDSLIALGELNQRSGDISTALERVAGNQTQLQRWAHHAPMNHQHKVDLVEAEKYRILGQKSEAIELYEKAISGAKANEYIQEEALANELAAKFYLDWGKQRIAGDYMIEAYYGYARWGAKAKVADLEQRYPQLLATILQQKVTSLTPTETIHASESRFASQTSSFGSSNSPSLVLDLSAILKASQNLSSEIQLDKLLSALLEIVTATAGADKCVLMLLNDNELSIEAVAQVGEIPVVLQSIPVSESEDVPVSLVNTVKRTLQPTVIMNAILHPSLLAEPYILRQQPKSLLCMPILHQGKLLGVLYLENNLATGAFTSDRVELLNLLCTQAAISLENARLYERSLDYAQQLEESFAELSASNSRFEKLVDNVPGVVYQARKTPKGVRELTYISADCYDLFEITPEQAIANVQFLTEMIHPNDAANYQQSVTNSIQTLTPLEWSGRMITPSGIVKWIHCEARIEQHADETLVWDGLVFDISEQQAALRDRKLAEKSLRLTQFAIDRSSVPVWWVKPSGQISYANDAACRELGYSRTEILQKYVWDFNPDFSLEGWEHHWQELKDRGSFIFETYNLSKSGHRYPVEVTVNYLELDGEEYNCSFVKNISDRKRIEAERQQAEAALRLSEERYRHLIGVTSQIVWMTDSVGQVVDIPTWRAYSGQSVEEISGFGWAESIHPDDRERTLQVWNHAVQTKSWYKTEYRIRAADGSYRHFDVKGVPILAEDGRIREWIGTCNDIDDRKRAEAALYASQQRLSLLIQQTPMAIVEWSPDFLLQSWNPAAEKIFGYTAAEVMGRSVDFLIADETVKLHVAQIVADILAQTGGKRSTNENITKAGKIIFCDWYNNPLVNEDGDLIGIATIAIDITDLKQAQEQLQASRQLLELVLDTIPHKVFWKDCNLIYQGSNRAFAEIVGLSSSTEVVGKSDYDLSWTTEESDWFRQCDRRVIEANLPELGIVETTLQADGTTAWIETSKLPLHDATGTVIGVLGIYQDISDRKQAEFQLQRKAGADQLLASIAQSINQSVRLDRALEGCLEQVRQFFQSDRILICRFDDDYNVVIELEVLSQPELSLLGQTIVDPCFNREWAERYRQGYITVCNDSQAVDIAPCYAEFLAQMQVQANLAVGVLANDQIWGMMIVHHCHTTHVWQQSEIDLFKQLGLQIGIAQQKANLYTQLEAELVERRLAEAALQEKELFLRSIYDGAEIVIFVLDVLENGSFRYAGWNAASERAIGIRGADTVGKTPTEVFGAVEGKNIEQRFAECASTGISIYSEDCLTFGGQEIWWFATINPIKNAEGRVYRIIGTTFDISDRKLAELALQQKSLLLEQALHNLQNAQLQIVQSEKMSALGNLVAGVAHEMNNPLGFISASLEEAKPTVAELIEHLKLYQETLPNPSDEIKDHASEIDLDYTLEDLPKIINSMGMACDRLRNISTSLRTFSRADKDYKVPFNIHEGIDSTILILKHRLKANEHRPAIEVITEYGKLPQVECFPGQLNQVFMNIMANAIDALDESNIGLSFADVKANLNRITVKTSVENELVKISITDNGQGMNESVKQKIFDHLFTTKAVGKGTGLGLAIARQIVVEKHSGSIQVNSIMGTGTEFIITLPTKAEQTS